MKRSDSRAFKPRFGKRGIVHQGKGRGHGQGHGQGQALVFPASIETPRRRSSGSLDFIADSITPGGTTPMFIIPQRNTVFTLASGSVSKARARARTAVVSPIWPSDHAATRRTWSELSVS